MLSTESLLKLFGYAGSEWFRTADRQFEPEAVQLFRLAKGRTEKNSASKATVLKTANGENLHSRRARRSALRMQQPRTPESSTAAFGTWATFPSSSSACRAKSASIVDFVTSRRAMRA